jgi:hypothetical protein
VEYALAQGGVEEGLAVARAVGQGGRFAHYRRELLALGYAPKGSASPRTKVGQARAGLLPVLTG